MSELPEVIYAIDMDGTTLDTNLFFDETAEICRREAVTGGGNLHEARKEVEASGGSFDTFGHLKQAGASDEELAGVAVILGDNTEGKEYLFPDTWDFLKTLCERGISFATVTYGSLLTQLPKLRATRLNSSPYLITDVKKKGDLIAGWRSEEGYSVHTDDGKTMRARRVILVDDKAASFDGLPDDCSGYQVQRKPPKPSQMGTVPQRIKKVKDLATITHIIRPKNN